MAPKTVFYSIKNSAYYRCKKERGWMRVKKIIRKTDFYPAKNSAYYRRKEKMELILLATLARDLPRKTDFHF